MNEVGISGQEKLTQAKVLVIGAGGLGCPVLQYLTAAGVGTIGIVDFDTVSLSNLQRQILFTEDDIHKNKALTAKKHLQSLNSNIQIVAYPIALNVANSLNLIADYDTVVDATDNFVTRYLINDSCIHLEKPMIYGSLYKFEGQVAVFNYKNGPSYRCLFPKPPKQNEVPNCSEIGILGVLPGQVGLLQATEVLKIILEIGTVLSGSLCYINVLTNEHRLLTIDRNDEYIKNIKENPISLVDTQDCEIHKDISIYDLNQNEDLLWIDVRELDELPRITLPNLISIPLNKLEDGIEQLRNKQKKIIFCHSGLRAKKAVQLLTDAQIPSCHNLKEGADAIDNWIKTKV